MIDYRREHAEALHDLDGLVSWVGLADLGRPTPCDGWDLRQLLAHLTGQHHGFAGAILGEAVTQADFADRPIAGDDWRTTTWTPSVARLGAAVAAADLGGTALLSEISPTHRFSVAAAVSFHLVDTVAHCWDVAETLGIEYRPSDPLVAAFLAESRRVPEGDARTSPGAAFGPVVSAIGDPWSEALGRLGRDVVSPVRARGRVGA
jgi:uncharacterized protein (TIGR03086 family)